MKHFRLGLQAMICTSAGLLLSTPTLAGSKSDSQVSINTSGRYAGGALGSVRNTSDSTQYIGCDVWAALAVCLATNASGAQASCLTYDSNLIANIRSLNGDSLVLFYWDVSGYCTQVIVSHGSSLAPKLP